MVSWLNAGNFQKTPLSECLEAILINFRLNFYISQSMQISIYKGAALTSLFPDEPQINVVYQKSAPKKKFRDILKHLQYQMVNIGTPGRSSTSFATVSGFLTNF